MEHTDQALYNLSCDNVYLLFVSFCCFHITFGLNQIVSMRDLLLLFTFEFICIKANINSPREGLLSSFTQCLECGINPRIHTFSGWASVSSRLLPLLCVKWLVFSKQQLIFIMFKRSGNLKGVAWFKKQTELYQYKCWSKSPTSSTFTFKRLSSSTVKVLTICLGLRCLC